MSLFVLSKDHVALLISLLVVMYFTCHYKDNNFDGFIGDYDGDKAIAIWQPAIVSVFKNAPLQYSSPPKDLLDNFKKETSRVSEIVVKHGSDPASMESQIQSFLLGGLQDQSLVGKYSNFHDIATYTLGYGHPETTRLAYMCAISCLELQLKFDIEEGSVMSLILQRMV